jgi:hypothetical protein
VNRRRKLGGHRHARGGEVDQRLPLRSLIARRACLLQRSRPRRERRHAALVIELELELHLE